MSDKVQYIFHLKDGNHIEVEDDAKNVDIFLEEVTIFMTSNRLGKISTSTDVLILKPTDISCIRIKGSTCSIIVKEEEAYTAEPEVLFEESVYEPDDYNTEIDIESLNREVDNMLNGDTMLDIDVDYIPEEKESIAEIKEIVPEKTVVQDDIQNLNIIDRVKMGIKQSGTKLGEATINVDRSTVLPTEQLDYFSNGDGLGDLDSPEPKVLKRKKKRDNSSQMV